MELTKKQAEFWGTLIGLMIAVALFVLLIDIQIKNAILEQSTRLRLAIEKEARDRGRGTEGTIPDGIYHESGYDAAIPADLLVDDATRMEARNVPERATPKVANSRKRRPPVNRGDSAGTSVPPGNDSMGTREET